MDTLKTGVDLASEQTRGEKQKIARDVKRVYYGLQQVESSLRSVRETDQALSGSRKAHCELRDAAKSR